MTRRITISLPDDVAEFVEKGEPNTSAYIADLIRRRMSTERLRAEWAAHGYHVTDEDVARARRRLAAMRPVTDEAYRANQEWLAARGAGQ